MNRELSNSLDVIEEECAEVISECSNIIKTVSKIKRFGFDSYSPFDPDMKSNLMLLAGELGDLWGTVNKFTGLYFGRDHDKANAFYEIIEQHKDAKGAKIDKYFSYTRQLEENGQI